ncbi:MAG: hypothetical protein WC755_05365 [Candidatus Woesearchaeota archaeon]
MKKILFLILIICCSGLVMSACGERVEIGGRTFEEIEGGKYKCVSGEGKGITCNPFTGDYISINLCEYYKENKEYLQAGSCGANNVFMPKKEGEEELSSTKDNCNADSDCKTILEKAGCTVGACATCKPEVLDICLKGSGVTFEKSGGVKEVIPPPEEETSLSSDAKPVFSKDDAALVKSLFGDNYVRRCTNCKGTSEEQKANRVAFEKAYGAGTADMPKMDWSEEGIKIPDPSDPHKFITLGPNGITGLNVNFNDLTDPVKKASAEMNIKMLTDKEFAKKTFEKLQAVKDEYDSKEMGWAALNRLGSTVTSYDLNFMDYYSDKWGWTNKALIEDTKKNYMEGGNSWWATLMFDSPAGMICSINTEKQGFRMPKEYRMGLTNKPFANSGSTFVSRWYVALYNLQGVDDFGIAVNSDQAYYQLELSIKTKESFKLKIFLCSNSECVLSGSAKSINISEDYYKIAVKNVSKSMNLKAICLATNVNVNGFDYTDSPEKYPYMNTQLQTIRNANGYVDDYFNCFEVKPLKFSELSLKTTIAGQSIGPTQAGTVIEDSTFTLGEDAIDLCDLFNDC